MCFLKGSSSAIGFLGRRRREIGWQDPKPCVAAIVPWKSQASWRFSEWESHALVFVCLFWALDTAKAAELRSWADSTGQFTREAEFQRLEEGVVVLRSHDDKVIRVPLSKLSVADREYVLKRTGDAKAASEKLRNEKPDMGKSDEAAAPEADLRAVWTSPYFEVRQVPGHPIWAFLLDGEYSVPFLLKEVCRDTKSVVLTNPTETFKLILLNDEAIVGNPEPLEVLKRFKVGGFWTAKSRPLMPTERTWHPSGSGQLRGSVGCLPAVSSEELKTQLESAAGPELIRINPPGGDAIDVSLKDLPPRERSIAIADLGLANAPRLVAKRHGKQFRDQDGRVFMYRIEGLLAIAIRKGMPADYGALAEASLDARAYRELASEVEACIGASKVVQECIQDALKKQPQLSEPMEMSVEALDDLMEEVLTKFPERLNQHALSIITGQSKNVEDLDEAMQQGDVDGVVAATSRMPEEEHQAFMLLVTKTAFGQVRSDKSRIPHIFLLSKACEAVEARGPAMCADYKRKEAIASDLIIAEQLKLLGVSADVLAGAGGGGAVRPAASHLE
jgi:hypothetical protein